MGSISGITVLGNELFVVQGRTWRGVDIYDLDSFVFRGHLAIAESKVLATIVA